MTRISFRWVAIVAASVLAGGWGCKAPGSSTPRQPDAPAKHAVATPFETLTLDIGEGQKMVLVKIPAGQFTMGSPESEEGHSTREAPQHVVTIEKPFFLGQTEVTQAQYQAVVRVNPSFHVGANWPVTRICLAEAEEFCRNMAHVTGRKVRLPSEAEWEYACRAGTTTRYFFGDDAAQLDDYAWCEPNAPKHVTEVCTKRPNPWGLCDMLGNAWEWCADPFHETYDGAPASGAVFDAPTNVTGFMVRGGSWFTKPAQCRPAMRLPRPPNFRSAYVSMRVVVEVE
jgi:formylglycine-generating enzyme required for sulfatase activity